MSMNTPYNGWTNYETWRVNLEMFDGLTAEDLAGRNTQDDKDERIAEVKRAAKDYAEEVIEQQASGLAYDYAYAFLSEVNFWEIAEHLIEGESFDTDTDTDSED